MNAARDRSVNREHDTAPPKLSRPSKRVAAACDYCRKKRLKCTTDQQPCNNCQLYNVECKDTRTPKPRTQRGLSHQRRERPSRRPLAKQTQDDEPQTGIATAGLQAPTSQGEHLVGMEDEVDMGDCLQDTQGPAPSEMQTSEAISTTQLYEPLAGENSFLDLSSDVRFTEPLDFWDPEISLHELITMGGIPDASSLSNTAPLTDRSREYDYMEDRSNLRDVVLHSTPGPSHPAHTSVATHRAGKISGLQSLQARTWSSEKHKRILPGLFIRKDTFNNNFIGLNSLGATLACGLREISESNPSLSKAESFNWMIDAGPHVDELDISMDVDVAMKELPSRVFATSSIKAYFQNVHVYFPVIDEHSFRQSWELLYDQESRERSISEVLVLCLVIAIGCSCESSSGYGSVQSHSTASNLFQRTWNLFPLIASRPRLAGVQIALLQVVFLIIQRKFGMAWVVCGQSVRLAQSLGLHRANPRDFDLSEEQAALRSRLWWMVFGLDATLSMSQGRPTAVHEHCYDAEPVPITLARHDFASTPTIVTNFFPWMVRLASIQNQFCGILSRVESVSARLDALATLDETLMEWRDAIPLQSRPEQEILVPHDDVYPIVAFLHLEYYNMLRALHWACITSVPANAGILKNHRNPRIQASDIICLAAARQFVKILNDLADKATHTRLVAPNLHIEYTIAALAALYRGIFSHPRRMSSKLDLEYFRAGKMYLDREIERTQSKPDYRPLFEGMMASLQELADRNHSSSGGSSFDARGGIAVNAS